MKNSILTKLGTLSIAMTLAVIITGVAPTAHAQDSQQQYIYCTLRDGMHSTVYYSDVFAGDYGQQIGYSVAFTNFVHGQFPNVIGVASCLFELGQSQARSAEDGWRSNDRRIYRQLVDTRWSY
jgi:hypothetical protein